MTTTKLDNGLTVVTERMNDVRSVALGFWVDIGSVDEEPSLAGASHFLEHLLFKGTDSRSARSIASAIDAVGGDMNAFTTKEYTAFYVRVLVEHLDLALDILSDIIWSPAFRPDEVELERQVILEEILTHADEPADLVHDLFSAALFPDHPLGREVAGDKDTVRRITRDEIAAFHAEYYLPANMVVAAAGRVDHAVVVDGLLQRFAGRSGGRPHPARRLPELPPQPVAVRRHPTEQAHLVLGMRALDRQHEDRYALSLIDHVLGGGMSSRLFQSIREQRGLVYSVFSYRVAFEQDGSLSVYAGTAPSHAHEVIELVIDEFNQLATKGVSPEELEAAKSHLRGSSALGLEDSGARMSRIGQSQLTHGRVIPLEEVDERLEAVTLDQVAELANRILSRPPVLAVAGPFDEDAFEDLVSRKRG